MAEVRLLAFARAALKVSRAVLPPYRTRFSKRQITPPQLLDILGLMRYEDWTFREAEVRLREHGELRQALELKSVPDFTTLYRFLRPVDEATLGRAVEETVRRLQGVGPGGRERPRVAVDATGMASGAVTTFFVRRMHHHGQRPPPWRYWLNWIVVVDLDRQCVLAQRARRGSLNEGEFAGCRRDRFRADPHRIGAGRCRVRQREESPLHWEATPSPECHPGQAWEEDLARA
jgi:Transposase domain (DUF772)